ncbi:hypothetical protein DTO164E3_7126 [Paecilomyces variotii]|nr:hypothetical protein DTO164E3_7126 [Paecilomyces variotii]KAJ9352904.1 hypothetical protein DTO280E4_7556 [Paecilomyces variotii]KAJ9404688.1 hypothetical protein DTO045G8_7521 [Paecilomyces variotii]
MRDFVTRLAAQTFLSSIYHLLLLTVRDTITLAMKHNVATFDAYVEEHGDDGRKPANNGDAAFVYIRPLFLPCSPMMHASEALDRLEASRADSKQNSPDEHQTFATPCLQDTLRWTNRGLIWHSELRQRSGHAKRAHRPAPASSQMAVEDQLYIYYYYSGTERAMDARDHKEQVKYEQTTDDPPAIHRSVTSVANVACLD